MAFREDITDALKRELKAQGLTYSQLARQLSLSEAAIKRAFSQSNFTLKRLDEICRVLNLDYEALIESSNAQTTKITLLSKEQEQFLVSDYRLLLVAICVQNGWTLEDITSYYEMSEPECVRHLIALEREGLIRLLRNNRIRRLISQDFQWRRDGPIEQFFNEFAESEFLKSGFAGKRDLRAYVMGLLTTDSINLIHERLHALMREFESLQVKDIPVPAKQRRNTGLLVAFRAWELSVFEQYKRQKVNTHDSATQPKSQNTKT